MKCSKCQFDNPDATNFCGKCGVPLTADAPLADSLTKTLATLLPVIAKDKLIAGKYRIIEEIGRGGMGLVYKAEDLQLQRCVALKFLPPHLMDSTELRERFLIEARAAAALSHPNVCVIHEVGESEERPYIAMEYIEGETLRDKIKQGLLKPEQALDYAVQVAAGLGEAHGKGIIHRDIKSANIMVTEKGQAKLMDFGLARVPGGALVTKEGMTLGTIAYMSPEQARGEKVDHRTDIWSFGVVLYEMFSGQLPFGGDHDQAVVYSILNEPPRPLTALRPDIPLTLGNVVSKALEKNPDERYQNMEELLADLKSIAGGLEPKGIGASLRRAKLLKRRRVILAAGSAGLFVIAAVAALSLLKRPAAAIDSIAVLPLVNLSGDPEQEYFVEGMHEELITELSKIKALKVISRPSVMRFRNLDKPLPEIAKELNVRGIIAGSALKEGERVRLSVQLIEAETERNLWVERYDRDYKDILALHGELALDVARQIKIAVTSAEQASLASARPVDSEAQDLYLKGRYYWNKLSPDLMEKTISFYRQSIEKDPTYALAYAGLAETYVWLSVGFAVLPSKDILPKARDAALRALELDPTLAEANVSMGIVATCYDWDRKAAKRYFDKALELNPDSLSVHLWIDFYLSFLEGEYRQSLAHLERAQELDPLNLFVKTRLGFMDYYLRDYDGAIKRFKEIADFDPNIPAAHLGLRESYFGKGMVDEALAEGEKVLQLGMRAESAVGGLGCLYGFAGKKDKARELLSELETRSKQGYVSPFWIGAVHMGLRETDEAFHWLEKAYEERDGSLIYITVPIAFDALGPDPRYKQLLQKMGLGHLFEKISSYKRSERASS